MSTGAGWRRVMISRPAKSADRMLPAGAGGMV
jgi:hypothetical protein